MSASVVQLAREASVELNVADVNDLDASREHLASGTKMYVSHLPRQRWEDSVTTCRAARAAGFTPVPHIPVRLLASASLLEILVERFTNAGVDELLLISGDYSTAAGPFTEVAQVLRSFPFAKRGIERISFAGHPEGHPKVSLDVIRAAEREKISLALDSKLRVTLLTQFFFEAEPFLRWAETLRDHRSAIRIVGGIAGPANTASLFKFALRCGVGPSMRALVANPSSMMKLARDHEPEGLLSDLAQSLKDSRSTVNPFDGIHVFGFGGFIRTCAWLKKIIDGRIRLTATAFDTTT